MKKIVLLLSFALLVMLPKEASAQMCAGGICAPENLNCGADYRKVRSDQCVSGYVCCPTTAQTGTTDDSFDVVAGPSNETFDELNPLKRYGESGLSENLVTPGAIVTRLLAFLLPMAGLVLFVMLIWGGFEVLAGSATKKTVDAGKQRIGAAVVGFILLFVAYWLFQILETIFGVAIL